MKSPDKKKQPEPRINGLTVRQVNAMRLARRVGRLARRHIEDELLQDVPEKSRARVARRLKASLVRCKFFKEHAPPGVIGQPEKLISLSQAGLEWYDATFDDESVMAMPTNFSQPFHQNHTLQLVDTHLMVRKAAKQLEGLDLRRWIIEDEIVNYWETSIKKRHTLRLLLQENPPIKVDPDAMFHVQFRGIDGVFAVEEDCMTIAAERVARIKSKGFATLCTGDEKRHRDFFPESKAKGFLVLLICPKPSRRDRLCEKLLDYGQRADLWRVAAKNELTPENFFTGEVWRTHEKKPVSLLPITRKTLPAVPSPASPLLEVAASTTTTGASLQVPATQ